MNKFIRQGYFSSSSFFPPLPPLLFLYLSNFFAGMRGGVTALFDSRVTFAGTVQEEQFILKKLLEFARECEDTEDIDAEVR